MQSNPYTAPESESIAPLLGKRGRRLSYSVSLNLVLSLLVLIAVLIQLPDRIIVILACAIPALILLINASRIYHWTTTGAKIVMNLAALLYAGVYAYCYYAGFILSTETAAPAFYMIQFAYFGAHCMLVVWLIAGITNYLSS